MAIDYIQITQDGTTGPRELAEAIELLRKARHQVEKVRGWMVHTQDGSDWSDFGARFGIPPGDASTVFTLVDGTFQVLNGSASGYADELMTRLG